MEYLEMYVRNCIELVIEILIELFCSQDSSKISISSMGYLL